MHKVHLRYRYQTPRERTWTIHLISLEKVLKASLLVFVGFKLLTLLGHDVHEWASDFVNRHHVQMVDRYVQPLLDKLIGVGDRQLREFSVVAFAYAGILYIEGVGLWLQKRWAEYLTTIATVLFIPFEVYEIYERVTWVRVLALAINIFIVWYLWTRLRDETAESKHTTFVKICGITNLDDAKQAVGAGADALGFNFYPASKRFITPERAAPIAAAIGARVCKIGVFVNSAPADIADVFEHVGLDAIQLHGDEDASFVQELRSLLPESTQIIRAVRLKGNDGVISPDTADAILIDAFSEADFGGTGEISNWAAARELVEEGAIVYLAGGLNPENVSDAVAQVHPFAVDACSGLERSPGLKDPSKVESFIRLAKQAI